jgi:alcohol dehydrogenase class IV
VLRYRARERPEALARIAEALGGGDAADAIARLIGELGLPRRLAEYRLSEADLAEAVRPLASEAYPAKDLLGILHAAM